MIRHLTYTTVKHWGRKEAWLTWVDHKSSIFTHESYFNTQLKLLLLNTNRVILNFNLTPLLSIYQSVSMVWYRLCKHTSCLPWCPSVRPSVRHTFLTMFPSSYHHEIFRSYYQWQKWRPCKRSRSEVKGQGHRGHNPTLPFPDCNSSLNSHMMMKWCI